MTEKSLFDVQPEWCRAKLDLSRVRDFEALNDRFKRLALFDPTESYTRISSIDPFSRYNTVFVGAIFPKQKGVCACGCGKELTGRRTVWASDECNRFAVNVQIVISGHSSLLDICRVLFGKDCYRCGKSELETQETHELDHLHPVKLGGGGGWLSNYEFKCKKCHRTKTNLDFGWKQESPQLKLYE